MLASAVTVAKNSRNSSDGLMSQALVKTSRSQSLSRATFTNMMQTTNRTDLDACYPSALIRGARIARLGEKYLGYLATDATTCRSLGEDQVGLFIGGISTFDRMIENARRINSANVGGRWIIVPATRCLAEIAYKQWFEDGSSFSDPKCKRRAGLNTATAMWHDDLVTFCVPEKLDELGRAIVDQDSAVAGIVLLDPNCIVHRGRGFGKGNYRITHDRPQLIVNFRSNLAVGNWSPPLVVMSLHRAAAVSTADVTRVYMLEAMHFIDGSSVNCGASKNSRNEIVSIPGRSATTPVSR